MNQEILVVVHQTQTGEKDPKAPNKVLKQARKLNHTNIPKSTLRNKNRMVGTVRLSIAIMSLMGAIMIQTIAIRIQTTVIKNQTIVIKNQIVDLMNQVVINKILAVGTMNLTTVTMIQITKEAKEKEITSQRTKMMLAPSTIVQLVRTVRMCGTGEEKLQDVERIGLEHHDLEQWIAIAQKMLNMPALICKAERRGWKEIAKTEIGT